MKKYLIIAAASSIFSISCSKVDTTPTSQSGSTESTVSPVAPVDPSAEASPDDTNVILNPVDSVSRKLN